MHARMRACTHARTHAGMDEWMGGWMRSVHVGMPNYVTSFVRGYFHAYVYVHLACVMGRTRPCLTRDYALVCLGLRFG